MYEKKVCINRWNLINEQKQPLKKVLYKNAWADVWRYSVKKMALNISQNSRESTCVRFSFLTNLKAESCSYY